jgi:hypothetical protein
VPGGNNQPTKPSLLKDPHFLQGGAAGAVAGGAGIYTIFSFVDLKAVFANNGSNIGMLDALGVFAALTLFAVFAYSRSIKTDGEKVSVLQYLVAGTFGVIVLGVAGVCWLLAPLSHRSGLARTCP